MLNFYRPFITHAAHMLAPLVQSLEGRINKNKSRSRVRTAKTAIAEAAHLRHPIPGAPLSIWVDAFRHCDGDPLMQFSRERWKHLVFFSMKSNKSKRNWSKYVIIFCFFGNKEISAYV